jgi:hypothetical protein
VLNFVGLTQGTVEMDLDNQAAGDIAQDYLASNRTKHLARRDFRVREARGSLYVTVVDQTRSHQG